MDVMAGFEGVATTRRRGSHLCLFSICHHFPYSITSSPPTALVLRTLSYIHISLIGQAELARRMPVAAARLIDKPLQPLLQKPLYPPIGMATAQANAGGSISDRHPVRQE
jgi:hypothetical protein